MLRYCTPSDECHLRLQLIFLDLEESVKRRAMRLKGSYRRDTAVVVGPSIVPACMRQPIIPALLPTPPLSFVPVTDRTGYSQWLLPSVVLYRAAGTIEGPLLLLYFHSYHFFLCASLRFGENRLWR